MNDLVYCLESWLETWNGQATVCRHDLHAKEHLIPEMLNESYFGQLHWRLRIGDLIFVTDAACNRATFLIEDVDPLERRVRFSILRTHYVEPITKPGPNEEDPGITVRFRGPRGGGWCIVDGGNQIIVRDLRTKKDAEEAMALMIAKRKAA